MGHSGWPIFWSLLAAFVASGLAYGAGLDYWPRVGIAIAAAWIAARVHDLWRRGRHTKRRKP